MENLIVEIGASTKEFLSGLNEVGDEAKSLEDKLKGVGAVAAVAFAGYTASIMGAVHAYGEQEKIGLEVEAMIKSTGGVAGVTGKMIDDLATSYSRLTTFSDDQVASAGKMLLAYTRVGKDVFPEATKASLDLAQKMGGDAAGAANLLGRALQDPEGGIKKLAKAGILFTDQQKAQIRVMQESGNTAGAQAIILKQVESQYGGLAEAAAGGLGAITGLKNAMGQLAEGIGGQFAPYVSSAAKALKGLVEAASDNPMIAKFGAAALATGAAVSGLLTVVVGGFVAFKQLQTALGGAQVAMQVFGLATRAAMGVTGVGLLLIVAYEVYANWSKLWPAMQELFRTFVTTVSKAASGLGQTLKGVFDLKPSEIKAGVAKAMEAFVEGAKGGTATISKLFTATPEMRAVAAETGKTLGETEAAAKIRALQAAEDAGRKLTRAARQAEYAADELQIKAHTQKVVALKKAEAAALRTLADADYQGNKALVRKSLADIRAEYKAEAANEIKQRELLGKQKYVQAAKLNRAEYAQAVASMKTRDDAIKQNAVDDLNFQIASDNTRLQEEERFGTVYAALNQIMHSKVVQGTMQATDQLVQMQQSSSNELKAIGRAAALWQIGVKTIESAENVYAGFATIPIIGQALGLAGAAAAVAFGIENARKVTAMATGGVVRGGIPGVDSVPIMAMPNEIITPAQNHDEYIDAMAEKRGWRRPSAGGRGNQGGGTVTHVIEFRGDAARMLQVRTVQDKAMGVYRGKR